MKVQIAAIQRFNPNDPDNAERKWYAIVESRGTIDVRDIAKEVAQFSGISVPAFMAANEALLIKVTEKVAAGFSVNLYPLGIYSLSVHCEGKATEAEIDAHAITGNSLNFLPSMEAKKVLKAIEYEKVQRSTSVMMGIQGVIRNSVTNAPIAGALVSVTGPNGFSASTHTNSLGVYQEPVMDAGTYTISITMTGFQPVSPANVTVNQSLITTQDFTMAPV